ncbi:40S ribosomal protein S19 [Candidatus Pacearchaeota archaeon]|nr:40S ribosomal protein S19 [Candidatus Pacearchaeota archaeon]
MTDIRMIEPGKYNSSLAEALKKLPEFKKPEWVDFVKTGASKKRPNIDSDFWYKRAASILRQIYVKKVVGVERLRTRYGSRKGKGAKPAHFYKAGGKIIRKILQQADSAGLTEKVKAKHSGRQLTAKGKEFLENLAGEAK